MYNEIKNKMAEMNQETINILDRIILFNLIKMKNILKERALEKIVLMHLSFFSNTIFIKVNELSEQEKDIYKNMILNSIIYSLRNYHIVINKYETIKLIDMYLIIKHGKFVD